MKLPITDLDLREQLDEFDQWITPALAGIRDSEVFQGQVASTVNAIRALQPHLQGDSVWTVNDIVTAVFQEADTRISGKDFEADCNAVITYHTDFFKFLLMASGATDNKLKNHYVIKLKSLGVKSPSLPSVSLKRRVGEEVGQYGSYSQRKLGNVVPMTRIAKDLARALVAMNVNYSSAFLSNEVAELKKHYKIYLRAYVELILATEHELRQTWALSKAFTFLENSSEESAGAALSTSLIQTIATFQVRGSYTASLGHVNEATLRDKLLLLGLVADVDFNLNDVEVSTVLDVNGSVEVSNAEATPQSKVRAYDFILPFKVDGWGDKPRLFVQSQFYEGDSGSVSHKVVDQTSSSRTQTLKRYPNSVFLEFLDGAGYAGALRGDLGHMLKFDSTQDFIQVKSILVRLRRALQQICFITPVEIEHAVLLSSDGDLQEVKQYLENDGYTSDEVDRAIQSAVAGGIIHCEANQLVISSERLSITRSLLLLDLAVLSSHPLELEEDDSEAVYLVPGYGANFGCTQSDLSKKIHQVGASVLWPDNSALQQDLEWLMVEQVISKHPINDA